MDSDTYDIRPLVIMFLMSACVKSDFQTIVPVLTEAAVLGSFLAAWSACSAAAYLVTAHFPGDILDRTWPRSLGGNVSRLILVGDQ